MQHSEWAQPTQDEVRELEYTQLEENNGNGKGQGNNQTSVPVNGGIWIVVAFAIIYGFLRSKWKPSHT